MDRSKTPALLAVARLLHEADLPYAIINGVALALHVREPRTTRDIDIAVAGRPRLPRESLQRAGFSLSGSFEHSEDWTAPDGVAVQFTDHEMHALSIRRAGTVEIEGVRLRVVGVADLLHAKLRYATLPERRRSERLQDLADAWALVAENPGLAEELTGSERDLLNCLLE